MAELQVKEKDVVLYEKLATRQKQSIKAEKTC